MHEVPPFRNETAKQTGRYKPESQWKQVLTSFAKNERETVQITLAEFNGYDVLGLRVYYRNKQGELCPTRKGLCIKLDRYQDFRDALEEAEQKLMARDMLPERREEA